MNKENTLTNDKKVYYKHFFFIFMAANIAIFFVLLYVSGGESAASLLYANSGDMFMDFFNSMLQNAADPYGSRVIYPPLANCMYSVLLLMVPKQYLEEIVTGENITKYDNGILKMQQFMAPLILYVLITSVLLFFVLVYFKKGSHAEKLIFTAIAIFSGPMVFQFERANSIIVAFIFVLFFLILYNSENKVLREIGLISLAVAFGVKLYPIVFAVFLIREKKYKEFIRTMIYCFILFFVPMFIVYGGFDGIKLLFSNISLYDVDYRLSTGAQLNFSKMLMLPLSLTNMANDTMIAICDTFRYVMTLSCGFAALFSKSKWKTATLCACVIYGFQGSCATYLLIMFLIPAAMLLDSEKIHSRLTYIYTFLLAVIVTGPAIINPVTGEWTRFVGTKVSSYAVLILSGMLIISGIKDMAEKLEQKLEISKRSVLLSFLISIAVMVFGGLFILPGGVPKRIGFLFGILDFSGFIKSEMTKNVILLVLAAVAFAGVIFLLWWLPKNDKYNGIRQFIKFGLVGVSNTFVSLAIYYIFYFIDTDLYFLGNAVGFVVSVLNAYVLNSHFVFKSEEKKSKMTGFKELMKSYAAYGATFILSEVLLIVQVEFMNISGVIAPVINLLVTIPLNYILNKFWTYGEKTNKSKKEN